MNPKPYVAERHWQHSDWTVRDRDTGRYVVRGLTEAEARSAVEEMNRWH